MQRNHCPDRIGVELIIHHVVVVPLFLAVEKIIEISYKKSMNLINLIVDRDVRIECFDLNSDTKI